MTAVIVTTVAEKIMSAPTKRYAYHGKSSFESDIISVCSKVYTPFGCPIASSLQPGSHESANKIIHVSPSANFRNPGQFQSHGIKWPKGGAQAIGLIVQRI